ncbi:MAG: type I-E CRISPR-associated endoribonuclease Cas2e [Actinomycetaceae bacterium]|nr:type I-E CRISPR-associated endoribonuclease Cas2e [Actinomycetaceae bacterium]
MTTVIVLKAADEGLRGHLTRWMVEVSAGVYVGQLRRRIRDAIWSTLESGIREGQAIMVEPAGNEQGWAIRTAGVDRWAPVDFDGLILMARERR